MDIKEIIHELAKREGRREAIESVIALVAIAALGYASIIIIYAK